MSSVRDYYERNTGTFLRLGAEKVIHRALWGPGAETLPDALNYAHRRIGERVGALGHVTPRVLDLGCGVGASALWLAEDPSLELVGVTISETQVALAQQFAADRGLAERCSFVLGDFGDLPPALGAFHAAYAIEAFAHAPDTDAFFRSVASRLVEGGRLLLVDDFVAPDVDPEHPVIRRFRDGWHVPAVTTTEAVTAVAARHGLTCEHDEDWTPYIGLWRPRDWLVHYLQPLIRLAAPRDLWLQSLVGGDALQVALSTGLIQYRWMVFERSAASARRIAEG